MAKSSSLHIASYHYVIHNLLFPNSGFSNLPSIAIDVTGEESRSRRGLCSGSKNDNLVQLEFGDFNF